MNNTNKPLILTFNEAKQQIVDIINSLHQQGLAYYFIEPFFADLASQLSSRAEIELKEVQQIYDKKDIEEDNTSEEQTAEDDTSA